MVEVGFGLAGLVLACVMGWIWHRQRQLDADMHKVMEVLAAASPALERRVMERGTQVVLGQQWVSDKDLEDM